MKSITRFLMSGQEYRIQRQAPNDSEVFANGWMEWAQDEHRTLSLSPQKGVRKSKTDVFGLKSHFDRRRSAIKFLCVKTISDKGVRHSLA